MTDHANELRRHARKIPHPQGETPGVMLRAADEIECLRAKIEQMERQEPVAWMLNCQTLDGNTGWILSWTQSGAGLCNRLSGEENEKKLYVLPGAKGE